MKKRFKKLIWCIVIFITVINLIITLFPTSADMALATDTSSSVETVETIDENADYDSMMDGVFNVLGTTLDGVVGIITWVIRAPLLLIGMGIQGLLTGIAKLGDDSGGNKIQGFLTPDDIFFNRVGITEIDLFNFSGESNVIQTIRINIATWYYILRILSIVLLLAVLVYIGIRMAISTVASEQAVYKRMLTDWLVSFALVFLLNYIIMFTIEANNALVKMLAGTAKVTIGEGVVKQLALMSISGMATKAWGALLVYFALIGMTTSFLLIYVKRMLIVGFLIIISPLITITYSIDKVKDGKAQALEVWLKEFMTTVLLQPFDCIIYLVFISTIIDTLKASSSLAKLILALMCMSFIWKAEEIVRKIFHIESQSVGNAMAAAIAVQSIGNTAKRVVGATTKAISKTKFGQNIGKKVSTSAPVKPIVSAAKAIDSNKIGHAVGSVIKHSVPAGIGMAAGAYEIGLGTSANAAQVGFQAYDATHAWMFPDASALGSKENIQQIQNDLNKFASYISKNNNFNFQNYGTDRTSKNNLRSYVNSLIGVNMAHIDASVSAALTALINANPTDYDTSTTVGMNNLHRLQDMAMDDSLDFNDPSTNPLGHAWTTEEKRVVSTIQTKNLATAVNSLHDNYEAAGSNNAKQDVDTFINSLT